MTFAEIQGNEELCRALSGMISSGQIPHAIMLHEDDGGGGMSIALAFLQQLYQSDKVAKFIHPDIYFVCPVSGSDISEAYSKFWRPLIAENPSFTSKELGEALGMESKNAIISVRESRFILEKLSLSALEGGYRSVIIYLPEKMNKEAANSLLKAIEEPEPLTQFIFITHAPEMVLPTIASRCQRLRVLPQGRQTTRDDSFENLMVSLMDSFAAADLPSALDLADELAALPSRESAKAFCRYASERFRAVFLVRQNLTPLVGADDERARAWASVCKPSFPRTALAVLSRAVMLLDRNVNVKILFTDLVCNLYTAYGK